MDSARAFSAAFRQFFARGGSIRRVITEPLQLLVLAQAAFLFLGIGWLSFDVSWEKVLTAALFAALAELALANRNFFLGKTRTVSWFFPWSALAAAFGVAIFFRALEVWYFALAALIAIASKYAVRAGERHVFNPSNFAVVMLVFLLPQTTTIEFTQWGSDAGVFLAVTSIALFIGYRAGVLLTTASFLLSYAALLVPLVAIAPGTFGVHHLGLLSPSLILFATFMITDPRTSPTGTVPRIVHGASVALMYFFLEILGVRYALFAASFSISVIHLATSYLFRLHALRHVPIALTHHVLSFALVLVVFATATTFVVRDAVHSFAWYRVSPAFLFMGIESERMQRCAANLAYERAGAVGEDDPYTTGGAWGDVDGDGAEELFVSSISYKSLSRLYARQPGGGFTDVTSRWGLPDFNSSSALFIDYDNNGTQDLLVAQDVKQDGSRLVVTAPRLFMNTGAKFEDVSATAGLSGVEPGVGYGYMSAADYGGDGRLDFVLATDGRVLSSTREGTRAYHKSRTDPFFAKRTSYLLCGKENIEHALASDGRAFDEDVEKNVRALISGESQGCLSYSRRLDMFSQVFEVPSLSITRLLYARYVHPGSVRMFVQGGSGFVERTEVAALMQKIQSTPSHSDVHNRRSFFSSVSGRYFQPVSFDYDGDGRVDIFLSTDFGRSTLLRNAGNARFEDATAASGLDWGGSGMGADVGDVNADGRPDLIVSNILDDYLFLNEGGRFALSQSPLGRIGIGWGVSFVDFDLDGAEDIMVAEGVTEKSENRDFEPELTRPLFRTNTLYRGDGQGNFKDATPELCPSPEIGMALALSDYDMDGDEDFFTGTFSSGNSVWENVRTDAPNSLVVRLRGSRSNRDAIGASVTVSHGDASQTKYMLAGSSFGSQRSRRLVFGLDTYEGTVQISVSWPSGAVSKISALHTAREVVIVEP